MTYMVVPGVVSASKPYYAHAVHFDGSTNFLERDAGLTGAVDGKLGTMSVWIDPITLTTGGDFIIDTDPLGHFRFEITSTRKVRVTLEDSAGFIVGRVTGGRTISTSDGWIHILASWDLLNTTINLWVDGVNDKASEVVANLTIDYTALNWAVGGQVDVHNWSPAMDIADVYLNIAEYVDFSVAANRAKFRSASGKPVNLGANGQVPTGTAPIMFLSGAFDATLPFKTNKGTGGGFGELGALTAGSSSPSD